jgi:hypothetical protein
MNAQAKNKRTAFEWIESFFVRLNLALLARKTRRQKKSSRPITEREDSEEEGKRQKSQDPAPRTNRFACLALLLLRSSNTITLTRAEMFQADKIFFCNFFARGKALISRARGGKRGHQGSRVNPGSLVSV